MDSLASEKTGNFVFSDANAFSYNYSAVDSADVAEFKKTVFVDMGDYETDFVHMCGEHKAVFRGFFTFFGNDKVSGVVGFRNAIRVTDNFVINKFFNCGFVAGSSGGKRKHFKIFKEGFHLNFLLLPLRMRQEACRRF